MKMTLAILMVHWILIVIRTLDFNDDESTLKC